MYISKDNIDDIVTEINLYGFCKIKLYEKNDKVFQELQKIHKLGIKAKLAGRIETYQGGFAKFFTAKEIYGSSINGVNYFLEWLNSDFIKSIVKKLQKKRKYKLDHLIQTLDTTKSKHIAQEPHFDRIPTLKFMLYLNDMNENNGAFVLSPGSHHWVKEKFKNNRGSFDDEKFFKETRNIPKPIVNKLISLDGKAGTLIVFHTDCIHMQGIPKENESRIFRAGYRFQSKNIIKNYVRKIRNKILQ